MEQDQPRRAKLLPDLWLISDARNDALLENALEALPEGSGFIFRHYHLEEAERQKRFEGLLGIARRKQHWVVLSGTAELARDWGAKGIYGPAENEPFADGLLRLMTAHNAAEVAAANAAKADAVLISPVFATRSHPGAAHLGEHGFKALAAQARMPVIALGGMTRERAQLLGWSKWAAIDGLSQVSREGQRSKDS